MIARGEGIIHHLTRERTNSSYINKKQTHYHFFMVSILAITNVNYALSIAESQPNLLVPFLCPNKQSTSTFANPRLPLVMECG
jgi:hypothetical protein